MRLIRIRRPEPLARGVSPQSPRQVDVALGSAPLCAVVALRTEYLDDLCGRSHRLHAQMPPPLSPLPNGIPILSFA